MKEKESTQTSDNEKNLDEPQVTTYERDELVLEVAFSRCDSVVFSDRNLKENFAPVDPRAML